MAPGCLGHSHELAQSTPEGKTRPLRALGRAGLEGWSQATRELESGRSHGGLLGQIVGGPASTPVVGRCPRQQIPLSPRLSPQTLEFGSYHCGQSTLQPPGIDKMARGPGARGVSGPRTQGAGPEENPGGRAAQRTWYLHLASLLRSVRCCRSTSALAEVMPGRGTPIRGVLHLKNADLCP